MIRNNQYYWARVPVKIRVILLYIFNKNGSRQQTFKSRQGERIMWAKGPGPGDPGKMLKMHCSRVQFPAVWVKLCFKTNKLFNKKYFNFQLCHIVKPIHLFFEFHLSVDQCSAWPTPTVITNALSHFCVQSFSLTEHARLCSFCWLQRWLVHSENMRLK